MRTQYFSVKSKRTLLSSEVIGDSVYCLLHISRGLLDGVYVEEHWLVTSESEHCYSSSRYETFEHALSAYCNSVALQ